MDRNFPVPFVPAPTHRRYSGWSIDRQQEFIRCLAETGSVTKSAEAVKMTRESAYRLRARPVSKQFAAAWDAALAQAGQQLLAVAVDRALNGSAHQYWKDGYLVAERIAPSDRLLMWAVDRLVPRAAAIPSAPANMEDTIAAIATDSEACSDLEADLLFAEEMGARGDAIWEANQRAANIQQLLDATSDLIERA